MALRHCEEAGQKLEIIRCNYNDIDAVTLARRCLEILLEKPALKEVSFIGNCPEGVRIFKDQFADKSIKLKLQEDGEENESEEEPQSEEEDFDDEFDEDKIAQITDKFSELNA